MKRKNEQSLKEVMQDILKLYDLEKKFTQAEIGQIWNEMLGPSVAKVTRSVKLHNGVVTVFLDSSLVKQELNMHRTRLVSALNESIGKDVVMAVELR